MSCVKGWPASNAAPLAGGMAIALQMFLMPPLATAAFPEISVDEAGQGELATGRVIAYGRKNEGQTNVPAGLEGVTAVAAGSHHSVALRGDGSVVAWGADSGEISIPLAARTEVAAIAAGRSHTLALRQDGGVVAWGKNDRGQCDVPPDLAPALAVAAGARHSVALQENGTVVAWGAGGDGQLEVPAGLTDVVSLAAGDLHTLALKSDGSIVAWGYNASGQCDVPPGLTGVVAVAAGDDFSVALTADGEVIEWGGRSAGQSRVPAGLGEVVTVAAGGDHVIAVKQNGNVVTWGLRLFDGTGPTEPLVGAQAVAAGGEHSQACLASRIDFGHQPAGTSSLPRIFTIRNSGATDLHIADLVLTGGHPHEFIIDDDETGAVVPVGGETAFAIRFSPQSGGHKHTRLRVISDDPDEGVFEIFLAGVVAPEISVFAGADPGDAEELASGGEVVHLPDTAPGSQPSSRTFTIRNDGSSLLADLAVSLSGPNDGEFQVTQPAKNTLAPGETTAFSVSFSPQAPGRRSAIVELTSNDEDEGTFRIKLTGRDPVPEISVAVDPGVELKTGMVAAWGFNQTDPVAPLPGLSGLIAVSAGDHHTLALTGDGSVVAWGDNRDGQASVPFGLNDVVAISAGWFYSVALKADGRVIAWGRNNWGQSSVPDGLTDVVAISAGTDHVLALKSDGTVVAWGRNHAWQTSVPSSLANVKAIAAGHHHSLALKNDGKVVGWGAARASSVPSWLTDIKAIAGGLRHSVALRSDGTVAMWGEFQVLHPPNYRFSNFAAISAAEHHNVALTHERTLVSWNTGADFHLAPYAPLAVPAGLTGVKAVSAKAANTAVLLDSVLDLGNHRTGEVAGRVVTIRNSGTAPLAIPGVAVAGGNSDAFSVDLGGMETTVAPGAETRFVISFSPEVPGACWANLILENNDPDEGDFGLMLTGKGVTPLEVWRDFHFNSIASDGPAADLADPDGDSLPNLLEYALGGDPTVAGASARGLEGTVTNDGFSFSYRRPSGGAAGVVYEVETADHDLSGWTAAVAGADYSQEVTGSGDGLETVTVVFSAHVTSRRFVRIRVSY